MPATISLNKSIAPNQREFANFPNGGSCPAQAIAGDSTLHPIATISTQGINILTLSTILSAGPGALTAFRVSCQGKSGGTPVYMFETDNTIGQGFLGVTRMSSPSLQKFPLHSGDSLLVQMDLGGAIPEVTVWGQSDTGISAAVECFGS